MKRPEVAGFGGGWPVAAAGLAAMAAALLFGAPFRRAPFRAVRVLADRSGTLANGDSPDSDLNGKFGPFAWVSSWIVGCVRHRTECAGRRSAALEVLAAFAAELRAGQPVRTALERACAAAPRAVCPRAVGVARLGGDVPRALQLDAADQGLPVLRSLAALWQVAEGSGAGLAKAVDRLCIAEGSNEQVRRSLASELAGPKATAKVLAVLPVIGLLMGSGLGASPLGWLLGSPWGLAVLLAGVVLEWAGLWWTARLTRAVEALL
ncbi:MAG: type II secretion system F family protein [Actinomycetes bacterium]